MMDAIRKVKKMIRICLCACILLAVQIKVSAQLYTIKNGKMYIEVNKHIDEKTLDSFIDRFELYDLAIKYFLQTNNPDSLKKMGWYFEMNNQEKFAVSKPLISAEDLLNVADKIIFMEKEPGNDLLFPAVDNGMILGYNRFKNKSPFATQDSLVTFYLRNNTKANRVVLAGSFNNFNRDALPMIKTDSGWIANVKLGPGKYWYKFIIDGNWKLDEDNQNRENDGKGNTNSIYYKTNYLFRLDTFTNAKKITLAGSFNNWNYKEIIMKRTATGWELPVYLANGTHTYRYIIDGEWKTDPTNPDKFPNEFNDYNSVIHLGKPYLFRLSGYENAEHVLVTGSFNYWRKDELYMKKTPAGWEFPYTLASGNYEYKFIVDGKEITDPSNPLIINNNGVKNSYLVLDPNYTFCLKGFPNAKEVYLAGDFNNFNPNSLVMKRSGDEWVFSVHLTKGKHIYKFIVDGQWMIDPANKQWEQNRYGTGDSVIWFGE